ncbi:MAG TPA: hypothetical protein VNP04_07795 [Alphaproteobacteria bacterium]|nr:hypothetical protein [Alphaproteobacteria bacterium]
MTMVMTLGTAREEFAVEMPDGKDAPSPEVQSTTHRATSQDLEGLRETPPPQAWGRHLESRAQVERVGDIEVEQVQTTSRAWPQASSAVPKELPTPVDAHAHKQNREVDRILRVHFASPLLADLRNIQRHCGTPTAAVYADSILRTIRAMRDLMPFDPYTEIAMALYDAMAFENHWLDYTAEQYEGAHHLLRNLADRSQLRNNDVEKAILNLEDLGFDTTPFEMNIELGNDVDHEG